MDLLDIDASGLVRDMDIGRSKRPLELGKGWYDAKYVILILRDWSDSFKTAALLRGKGVDRFLKRSWQE